MPPQPINSTISSFGKAAAIVASSGGAKRGPDRDRDRPPSESASVGAAAPASAHFGQSPRGASGGIAAAKDTVAQYAAQARAELSGLPDVPGTRALASLVDYTVNRHG